MIWWNHYVPGCISDIHDVPWSFDPIWSIVQARALPGAAAPAGSQAQGPTKQTWILMAKNVGLLRPWGKLHMTLFCCRMLRLSCTFFLVLSWSFWDFLGLLVSLVLICVCVCLVLLFKEQPCCQSRPQKSLNWSRFPSTGVQTSKG